MQSALHILDDLQSWLHEKLVILHASFIFFAQIMQKSLKDHWTNVVNELNRIWLEYGIRSPYFIEIWTFAGIVFCGEACEDKIRAGRTNFHCELAPV
jgi:hypothetical protein